MWTYLECSTDSTSSQESADSRLHSSHGSGQSPTVRTTDTPRLFYFRGCPAAPYLLHRSGMTSELWVPTTLPVSTSYQRGSPARTSALQELERAWAESGRDYSSRSCDSLASFDPASSSWRTSQLSLLEEGGGSLGSLPPSGMTVDGRLYQPQSLAPHTFVDDGSCLPTPTATEYGSGQNGTRDGVTAYANPKAPSLSTMARRMRPTPRASDGEKGSPNQKLHGEPSLAARAVRLPTPCSRDGKDGCTPSQHGSDSKLAVTVSERGHSGYLNPAFVEVMMGIPIGWTALEHWAMQYVRPKRGKRSGG